MLSTTTFRRGDVVLVPFPFTDLTGNSQRPALVISDDPYHQTTDDIIIALITGRISTARRAGDHTILDWQSAGLLRPSKVRARLATIDGRIVVRGLGHMPATDMSAFEIGLRAVLGF